MRSPTYPIDTPGWIEIGYNLREVKESYKTFNLGNTGERVYVNCKHSTVYANGGEDSIGLDYWSSEYDVIYGGAGNDFISDRSSAVYANYCSLYGEAGNDLIVVSGDLCYADGGTGNDTLYVFYNVHSYTTNLHSMTCLGGDGDDLFVMCGDSNVSIAGGIGSNTYRFDPYSGTSYHNEVTVTDFTSDDVIEFYTEYYRGGNTDGSELNYKYDSDGNVVLYDQNTGFFSMTLEGVTDIREIAGVKYHSTKKDTTIGEIFSITGGDNNVSLNATGTVAKITSKYNEGTFKVADYGNGIVTIDASAAARDLSIMGNNKANRIIGSDYEDSINGSTGKDTLFGGAGNDTFSYKSGDGNDLILDYTADEDKIHITSGTISSVSVSGDNVIFTVGKGKITVKGGKGQDITITDAKGKDSIYNSDGVSDEQPYSINAAGTAIELLETYTESTFNVADVSSKIKTIVASAVTDDLYITGNSLANNIIGGSGDNTIDGGDKNDTLTGGDGADVFIYSENSGNDVITDYNADEDKVKITNGAISKVTVDNDNVIIYVGENKLTIKNGRKQEDITIINEKGIESIYSVNETYSLNAEGTAIKLLEGYEEESFNAANLTDYAKLKTIDGSAVTYGLEIIGNKIANKIIGTTEDDTLSGAKGNDTLYGGDGADTFVYKTGDGKDVIQDYDEEDIIQITSGTISNIATSGKNVVFTVGTGKITVKDAADKTITYIDEDGIEHIYPEPVEVLRWNSANTMVEILEGYEEESFDATDYAKLKTIDGSAASQGLEIIGNKLANKIIGTTEDDTLSGAKGNDTLYGGEGADTFVYKTGDGKDYILDYDEEDIIQITSGTISNIATSGKNVVFTVGTGKITVKDAADKTVTYIDENGIEHIYPEPVRWNSAKTMVEILEGYKEESFDATDYAKLKTIDGSVASQGLEIIGNKLANKIIGTTEDDTLSGAKGNDTLYGGEGADTFVYKTGDGKDYILDYDEEDIIQIASGPISNIATSDNDVVFTVGKGTITVKDAADKTITYIDENDEEHIYPEPDEVLRWNSANTMVEILEGYEEESFGAADYSKLKTIDGSAAFHGLEIIGNKIANKIIGTAEDDTLSGAKGNDSLWGGEGADIFLYETGDGKDVIFGFDDNDMLEITGTFTASYNKSKNEIAFKVGSTANAITLRDFTATTFNINGDEYKIKDTKLVK